MLFKQTFHSCLSAADTRAMLSLLGRAWCGVDVSCDSALRELRDLGQDVGARPACRTSWGLGTGCGLALRLDGISSAVDIQ